MDYFLDKLYALLPEVHRLRDNGDLHDLLAAFAPTLDWIKELIDAFPELWDLDAVPDELLPYLGAIIGYPYDRTRDPDVQRKLIRFRIEFYRRKGTRPSLDRLLAEAGVSATVLENVPREGVYQVIADAPPVWLPAMLEEIHPAGTKWVYLAGRVAYVEDATVHGTAIERLARRRSVSCLAACGFVEMMTV